MSQVSDEGGGIPRSGLPRIWTYLYTTAKSPVELQGGAEADAGPAVLAGYGYVGTMLSVSMHVHNTLQHQQCNAVGTVIVTNIPCDTSSFF